MVLIQPFAEMEELFQYLDSTDMEHYIHIVRSVFRARGNQLDIEITQSRIISHNQPTPTKKSSHLHDDPVNHAITGPKLPNSE